MTMTNFIRGGAEGGDNSSIQKTLDQMLIVAELCKQLA